MRHAFYNRIQHDLTALRSAGLFKVERVLTAPQAPATRLRDDDGSERDIVNFCANNYLGLASDPRIIAAANEATSRWGAGLASVRFICGTQAIHKELEETIADYLGFDDAILFAAAFDANGAVFEPLFGPTDAIVSDSLNHASIIDGIRLSKARRYRFANGDLEALETALLSARAEGAETILIATDGVFSMDGIVADIASIADLADRYDALLLVDDCHATGVVGACGRGSVGAPQAEGRVDIVTGTFGKALGGAMGGFVAARAPIVEWLRQRGRPYLFSNALAPAMCGASLAAIEISRSHEGDDLRVKLKGNAARLRSGLSAAGFHLIPGHHPIVPVMLGSAPVAQEMARLLFDEGIYVAGFFFPVVPHGKARIRTQLSAAHSHDQIDHAISAFTVVGKKLKVIP